MVLTCFFLFWLTNPLNCWFWILIILLQQTVYFLPTAAFWILRYSDIVGVMPMFHCPYSIHDFIFLCGSKPLNDQVHKQFVKLNHYWSKLSIWTDFCWLNVHWWEFCCQRGWGWRPSKGTFYIQNTRPAVLHHAVVASAYQCAVVRTQSA